MQLREIRLNDFGKFHNKSIPLKDGINLIYGENEAGKSTIHSFIKGMLFGIEKLRGRVSKEDSYVKFIPWENTGSYSGSMDIEVEGKAIRILRNFDKNNKNCTMIDLETGRELELNTEELTRLYGGLTEAGYRNTISIEQLKARTEQELVEEVRNYITNLSLSKSNEVDVTKALSFLQDRRKELEAQQLSAKLSSLEKDIEEGLVQEVKIDKLTLQLKETEEKEKVLGKKAVISDNLEFMGDFPSINAYQSYLEQFPVVKEKFSNYNEAKHQIDLFKVKQSSIQERLQEYNEDTSEVLHEQLEELDTLRFDITTLEGEKASFIKEDEKEIDQDRKRRVTVSLFPIISGIVGILYFIGKNSLILGVSAIVLLLGMILYVLSTSSIHKKRDKSNLKNAEYDKNIALLKDKVKAILMKFNAADERTLKKKYEEALRQEMSYDNLQKQKKDYGEQIDLLNKRNRVLEQEILEYINRTAVRQDASGSAIVTLDESTMENFEKFIIQQKQFISRNQELITKEFENLRIQKEKLKWELNSLEGNEENLLQNQELYQELLQKKTVTDLELEAIKLSIETINSLSIDIHDSFGKKLNDLVSELARGLTFGKYIDIKIDEKLNIKVGYKDKFVLLNKLSAGTIEQFYFALRIAISDLVYGHGVMPILLDDCFALYDDKRTQAALEYLSKQRQGQVILFTCHNREKTILEGLNLNYNYIDLSESN